MATRKPRLYISDVHGCVQLLYDKFDVITYAEYFYRKGDVNTNFDSVLEFDKNIYKDIRTVCESEDIPIIGTRRYSKFEQNILLRDVGITCPDTYDCQVFKGKNTDTLDALLSDVPDDMDIILKSREGARGIGQVKMKRGEIYDKLNDLYDPKSKATKEAESLNDEHKNHKGYLSEQIKNGWYCVQIFEEDIKEEYRILYFYENDPIIMKRTRGDSTWQSNLGAKPDNKTEYIGNDIKKIFSTNDVKAIDEFFHSLDTPFLSLDVYKDRKGGMGIIEFQMEFAHSNVPSNILCKNMNSSVSRMLVKKKQS